MQQDWEELHNEEPEIINDETNEEGLKNEIELDE